MSLYFILCHISSCFHTQLIRYGPFIMKGPLGRDALLFSVEAAQSVSVTLTQLEQMMHCTFQSKEEGRPSSARCSTGCPSYMPEGTSHL